MKKRVWEKQLDKIFMSKEETELDIILKLVPLVLNHQTNDDDQAELYNCLGLDKYISFCKTFDGKMVSSIPESKIKDILIFIVCFYYIEIEGMSFDEIREIVPFSICSNAAISYGIRRSNLNKDLHKRMMNMMTE